MKSEQENKATRMERMLQNFVTFNEEWLQEPDGNAEIWLVRPMDAFLDGCLLPTLSVELVRLGVFRLRVRFSNSFGIHPVLLWKRKACSIEENFIKIVAILPSPW